MRVSLRGRANGGTFAPAELFDPQEFRAKFSSDIRVESLVLPRPIDKI
jgi:hypothetical protein